MSQLDEGGYAADKALAHSLREAAKDAKKTGKDKPLSTNSYITSRAVETSIRLYGQAVPFSEWKKSIALDNGKLWKTGAHSKFSGFTVPRGQLSPWPKMGRPAASNAVPIGSSLLSCTGLAPRKPVPNMKPSRPHDKGSEWAVIYEYSVEQPRVYLPSYVEVFDRLAADGDLSTLRDCHLVTHNNGKLALVQFGAPKMTIYDYIGWGGYGITTNARPNSKGIELAEKTVRELFAHIPKSVLGRLKFKMVRGNKFAHRNRHRKAVSVPIGSRKVQVKVRGNSWGLHHAYRQNGTVKHLLLGSVPASVRKGRTAPDTPLAVQKLVLDTYSYFVRGRKTAQAAKLRPFLPV